MKHTEQLQQWVQGNSIHNKKLNECCPDFSCCNNEINTPNKLKHEFIKAHFNDDHKTKDRMLIGFLTVMLSTKKAKKRLGNKKVYITK